MAEPADSFHPQPQRHTTLRHQSSPELVAVPHCRHQRYCVGERVGSVQRRQPRQHSIGLAGPRPADYEGGVGPRWTWGKFREGQLRH